LDEPEIIGGASTIERRLEALADEIGRIIEDGPREEREALRDYAVCLIRNQSQARAEDFAGAAEPFDAAGDRPSSDQAPSGSSAATLIGYGFLLLPAGGLLVLVLPPIGLMLGLTAFVMIATGMGVSVIARIRGLSA
jgi:hypothetical protein